MAVRTTDAAVQGIIDTDATIPLTPFIETANNLVTELCTATPPGYDATKLELIERWLSAHFYAVRDPRTVAETAGSVSDTFRGKVALHLDQTVYGQQAMLLDTFGNLASLNLRMKGKGSGSPSVSWAGKTLT